MLSHLCSRSIIYFIFLHDSLKNFTSCDTRCYTVQNPVLRFLVYINDLICRFLSNKDVFLYSKGRISVFKRGVSQSSKGRGLKKFSRGLRPRTPIIPYPPTSRLLAPPLVSADSNVLEFGIFCNVWCCQSNTFLVSPLHLSEQKCLNQKLEL